MKLQTKLIFLSLVFSLMSLAGCLSGKLAIHEGEERLKNLAITDEIVAFGKPSPELAKALELEHAVAFIGLDHTYLLYEGGEEIERISKSNLDGRLIHAGTTWSTYVKENKVWGNIVISYACDAKPSNEVLSTLKKEGFVLVRWSSCYYTKNIWVEGIIAPAIEIPKNQLANLPNRVRIMLYTPDSSAQSKLKNTTAAPTKVAAALLDVVLMPVYFTWGGLVMFTMVVGH